jgi:hypothetical protein
MADTAAIQRKDAMPVTPAEWDLYIGSAPNLAVAIERFEAAVMAGVDVAILSTLQGARHASR